MKKIKKWIRNNKQKIIVSIIAILVIIASTIIISTIIHNKKYKYEVEEISDYNYFSFYQDGKVGVIDTKGNIVISPNYYNVQIPNPSKPVFVCISEYNIENGSYNSKVYNEKNEEIITGYDKIEAISINGTVSNIPFEKEVLKYKKGDKYGLMTLDGKKITKPIYDDIQSLKYKEGQLLVKIDDKYGVINQKGQNLISVEYNDINGDGFYTEKNGYTLSGYIVCIKTQDGYRYGYMNNYGRVLLKTEYSELYRLNQLDNKKDIYIVARKDGKYGIVKNKKIVIDFDNQNIDYDNRMQLFIAQKNNKYGVYELSGKQILERRYARNRYRGNLHSCKIK